jgi:hypothetical protein
MFNARINTKTRLVALAAIFMPALFMTAGSASAQAVQSVRVEVRTGGDNLRGGQDNAFVALIINNGAVVRRQVNGRNGELKDYTTTRQDIDLRSLGIDLADIQGMSLSVRGFTGGFNGDNWNVDAIRIEANTSAGRRVLMNEAASPLVRFTGENKFFERRF